MKDAITRQRAVTDDTSDSGGFLIPRCAEHWIVSMMKAYDDLDFMRAHFPTLLRYTDLHGLARSRQVPR